MSKLINILSSYISREDQKPKKLFYRYELNYTGGGTVSIILSTFYSQRETKCYHFCSRDFDSSEYGRLRRICKLGSRIAFETKDEAMLDFLRRKRLRKTYLENELEAINALLEATKVPEKERLTFGKIVANLRAAPTGDYFTIPNKYKSITRGDNKRINFDTEEFEFDLEE